jgi:hypothetical protein
MIQEIPMSSEEIGVLYRLFMANQSITRMVVERENGMPLAVLQLQEGKTLYFPYSPMRIVVTTMEQQ